MPETTFRAGNPEHIDYTPAAGAVSAGMVVALGNTTGLTCGIAHADIANNVKGSLQIGGEYDVINLNNAANFAKVWWDFAVDKVTTVSTNNCLFGFIVRNGGGGANSTAVARHFPFV